jgi:hypothetical protein
MKNISYFFSILKKSDISLLGYSFKNENIKDEIISKIPCVKIKEIDSSLSIRSYLRDEKLNYLIEDSLNIKWLVLDINEIINNTTTQKVIKDVIYKIREDMYSYTDKPFYKLLILTPMNISNINHSNFKCGISPVYMSDFVSIINNGSLEVFKNRFDDDNKKISLDRLKDYTYICNYENSQ